MDNPQTEETTETFYLPPHRVRIEERTRPSKSAPWGDPVVIYDQETSNAPVSQQRIRGLWRDPEWREKIRKNRFASFPYSNTGVAVKPGTADLVPRQWRARTSTREVRTYVSGLAMRRGEYTTTLPALVGQPGQRDLLITEAIAEAKSGALQAMVSLMEGPKTFRMIADTAATIAHLLKVARRRLLGDKRELKRLLDRIEVHGAQDAVSWWLQYRYGWRILLLELKAVMDVLMDETANIADLLRRSRATYDSETMSSSTTKIQRQIYQPSGASHPEGALFLSGQVTQKTERYRGSALVFYTLDEVAALQHNFGLHAAPTLWELLPGSFVAEWFVNIGDWLQAYAVSVPGLKWAGGQFSELIVVSKEIKATGGFHGNTSGSFDLGESNSGVIERYRFNRTVFDPATTILPPVVFNDLNLVRAVDAVALLTQRFGRLSRDASTWRFKLPRS